MSLSAESARPSRETDLGGDLVNDRLVCSINVLLSRLAKLGVKLRSSDSCVSLSIRVASVDSTSSRATLSEKQSPLRMMTFACRFLYIPKPLSCGVTYSIVLVANTCEESNWNLLLCVETNE